MTDTAIEIATFRLASGTTEAFLAANAEIDLWLGRQPGFVQRRLAEREDGALVDIVTWRTLADAKAAAERFPLDLANCPAMSMIDPARMEMTHGLLKHAIG